MDDALYAANGNRRLVSFQIGGVKAPVRYIELTPGIARRIASLRYEGRMIDIKGMGVWDPLKGLL